MGAGKNETIDALRRAFEARGIECRREGFRVPAFPQITASAGLGLCSAGALLLAAGRPPSSFLIGIAGFLVLLLDAYGFSPLDWLGPKEKRSALVLPGTPSEGRQKALFLAIPLSCRLIGPAASSREAASRTRLHRLGLLLALVFPLLEGAATLQYLPPQRGAGTLGAMAFALLAAAEWRRGNAAPGTRNLAAGWVDRWALPPDARPRPYIYVYPGDAADVKFFLAKYRGPLLRGSGVFLEFPEEASGPPAVSGREGPFIPYKVDEDLLARVLHAGASCGLTVPRSMTLRFVSPGLVAMARGFRAVTLFRPEPSPGGNQATSDENIIAWVQRIAEGEAEAASRPEDLTGDRGGV